MPRTAIGHRAAVITLALLVAPLVASDRFELGMPDVVSLADRIAWVHVEGREEVRLSEHGDYLCGYVYSATVVRPIKGDRSSFRFFSQYEWTKDGGNRDYLVLAHRWSVEGLEMLRERLSRRIAGPELERAECGLGSAEFLSQTAPREMMIQIVATGPHKDQPVGLSSQSNFLGRDEFPHEELRLGDTHVWAVKWADIERTIRQALE